MVKKNAVGSFLIKLFAILIDFLKVPVLLLYMDAETYGVFLTISSIISWTHQFDFGLGAGLRFKLTKALSLNDTERGRALVSTAYISMSTVMLLVFLAFAPVIPRLDWVSILNTSKVSGTELATCVYLVLGIFLVQFVLELISIVFQSYQKAAFASAFKPIANVVMLLTFIGLTFFSHNSLTLACLAMTLPIVVVLLGFSIYYYHTRFHAIRPSLSYFRKGCIKDIYSLGLKFFIGQLSSLFVFQTATFLLSHYTNPTEAAVYSTAWMFFGFIVVFNQMVTTPLIAAITEAHTKGDSPWIRRAFKKISLYSLSLSGLSLFILAVSHIFFDIWLGDKLYIPWDLSIVMTIYFICNIWISPYQNFLTGVGKYQAQMYLSIVKIFVFLPVAIFMIKSMGAVGLILAILCVNTIPNLLLGIYQYYLIINHRAVGIWNK